MGYYTRYELETNDDHYDDDGNLINHEEQIALISGYTNPFDDECKWYSHQDHMKKYSKLCPAIIFTLVGEGEEPGDLWKEYYLNGRIQVEKAVISIGDFDISKLT